MNVESIVVTSAAGAGLLGLFVHWTWTAFRFIQDAGRNSKQLVPNGGSSMRDEVTAMNKRIVVMATAQEEGNAKLDQVVLAVEQLQALQRRGRVRR